MRSVGRPWTVSVVGLVLLLSSGCTYITRVSLAANGGNPSAESFNPSISGDGRYVTFWSGANNLVPGDDNRVNDVFVRDLRTNTTVRASVDMGGDDANGESFFPSISADGRYVAFASAATDLVPGDGGATDDIYVRDLQTGTTTRVSVDTTGGDPNAGTRHAWISGDGRHVVFASQASDLVPADGNGTEDVFVRDLDAGTTTRVSIDLAGNDANAASGSGGSFVPSAISADGRYVEFWSNASDLVAADGNGLGDVFLRDVLMATTERVTVDTAGDDANGRSDFTCGVDGQSISADARYVVFCSYASDLVAADGNGTADVFVRDRLLHITTRLSGAFDGDPTGGSGSSPSISADGRFVAFFSGATDIVPDDNNGVIDVFVRDRLTASTVRASVNVLASQANGASAVGQISADGHYVTFHSSANNLVAGDQNGTFDIFVRAVVTPTVDSVTPGTLAPGANALLLLHGTGFLPGARVSAQAFGPFGIHVSSVTVNSPTELAVAVTVDPNAEAGPRNVVAWNPGTGPGALSTGYGFCFGCLVVT